MLVVSCAEPHGAQAYFAGEIWDAGAPYPGDAAVNAAWLARCESEFRTLAGKSLYESTFELNGWSPDAQGWADGPRRIGCIAFDSTGVDLMAAIGSPT